MIENWVNRAWQKRHWILILLFPLRCIYGLISQIRRKLYEMDLLKRYQAPVPVIIIGNITVGGTGKTPLTIFLSQTLKSYGFFPGIISRGYKSNITSPVQVHSTSDAARYGDEPVLLAQRTTVPVFVHPNRALAIQALCKHYPQCDLILCDDGLQHYSLKRDIEIAVIDTTRFFGNRWLLPMGPLREPISRLSTVDFIVYNGLEPASAHNFTSPTNKLIHMQLQADLFYQLTCPEKHQSASYFINKQCYAIAAIGNPSRFFQQLKKWNINCPCKAFPDHYFFKKKDLPISTIVLVTEKDAVKLESLKDDRIWVLPVNALTKPNIGALIAHQLRIRK